MYVQVCMSVCLSATYVLVPSDAKRKYEILLEMKLQKFLSCPQHGYSVSSSC